jgi:hypothetical protein
MLHRLACRLCDERACWRASVCGQSVRYPFCGDCLTKVEFFAHDVDLIGSEQVTS